MRPSSFQFLASFPEISVWHEPLLHPVHELTPEPTDAFSHAPPLLIGLEQGRLL
ncbi:hypothetical protein K470DRAFT_255379 [Piedraia hortae CBS 480.64]|uniref:Uncharacterized protein n=1 Tax=Piedraia hortae CBS 480.64 TaxID=1314780 RepID=A0A6A7C869_9PEZI|nr:hypothetical protein K470DRAFT_255379 [Piedraia hortae CBS 480.64]